VPLSGNGQGLFFMEEQLAKLDLFKPRVDIERKLRAILKLKNAREPRRAA
jgi:hypothetical protein